MYVCICNAVTDRTIRDAARGGVKDLDHLATVTGAGSCCGQCRPLALSIIEETRHDGPHVESDFGVPFAA